jgi:hypothetical protein
MGWQIGFDSRWNRDIGYGVPAPCDQPGCPEEIDRGLGFVCGDDPYGGEHGCGLYFCGRHRAGCVEYQAYGETHYARVCERCEAGEPPFDPKPDLAEWLNWKLADESWARWRQENPVEVERIRALAGSEAGQ